MIADRWGVTDHEVARSYPCDDLVSAPAWGAWRGVSIAAPPEAVWPWVAQIRLAPYSYDWIDNLGRRSPQQLRSDLAEPRVGEPFTTAVRRPLGRILSVTRGEQLTGIILGTTISYVLAPDGDSTRLLMKLLTPGLRWAAPLLSAGDLVMARRQLLNLRALAERAA